jgi:CubicO group peptidase (beta-lactamase class C family)
MHTLLLLALLCTTLLLPAQQTPKNVQDRIHAVENNLAPNTVYGDSAPRLNIQKQMEAYAIPGLSIAVIKDYKIDWAKGYGLADVEEKRIVTTDTRFQAASISKSINGLAMLKLVQQGRIDPATDINTYLHSWKFPYDSLSKNKKITLLNLLSHTAGLSVHGFRGYKTSDTLPSVIQILNGSKPANSPAIRSLFEPGLKFQYSGGGTTISQLMLTDITGRRYDEFLQKEILQPLGMTNSFFTQPPAPGTKELATAHNNGMPVKGKYHVYPEQAAAGLWTTPTDLARYIIEMQLEYEGKSSKILNQNMAVKRVTPYIDSNAAMGVFIVKNEGDRYFSHNGGNEGFLCTSYGSFKDGNGVVVMINGSNFNILNEVVNSVARVYNWKDFYKPTLKKVYTPSKDTLLSYVGNYLIATDTISLQMCGDNLCIRQNGEPAAGLKVIFSNGTSFTVAEVANASFTMQFKEGKVSSFELVQGGQKLVVMKLE